MTPTIALTALLLAPAPYHFEVDVPQPNIRAIEAPLPLDLVDASKLWVFVHYTADDNASDAPADESDSTIDWIRVWGLRHADDICIEAGKMLVELGQDAPGIARYGYLEIERPEENRASFQKKATKTIEALRGLADAHAEHLGFIEVYEGQDEIDACEGDPSLERELVAKNQDKLMGVVPRPLLELDRDKCLHGVDHDISEWSHDIKIDGTAADAAITALIGDREHASQLLTGELERFRALVLIEQLKAMLMEDPEWGYSWRRLHYPENLAKGLRAVRRSNHALRHIRRQHQFIRALNQTLGAEFEHGDDERARQLELELAHVEDMIRYNNLCASYLEEGEYCPRSGKTSMTESHRYYSASRFISGKENDIELLAKYEEYLAGLQPETIARLRMLARQSIDPLLPKESKSISDIDREKLRGIIIDAALRRVLVAPGDGALVDPRDPIEQLKTIVIPELRKLALGELREARSPINEPHTLLDRKNVIFQVSPVDSALRISASYIVSDTYFELWDWKRGYLSYESPAGRGGRIWLTDAIRSHCDPGDCPITRIRVDGEDVEFFDIPERVEPGKIWVGADQRRLQFVFDAVAVVVPHNIQFIGNETRAAFFTKWHQAQSELIGHPHFDMDCGETTLKSLYRDAILEMIVHVRDWRIPMGLTIQCAYRDEQGSLNGHTVIYHAGQ